MDHLTNDPGGDLISHSVYIWPEAHNQRHLAGDMILFGKGADFFRLR